MTTQPNPPDKSGAVVDLRLIVVDGGAGQACSVDGVCGPVIPADTQEEHAS